MRIWLSGDHLQLHHQLSHEKHLPSLSRITKASSDVLSSESDRLLQNYDFLEVADYAAN